MRSSSRQQWRHAFSFALLFFIFNADTMSCGANTTAAWAVTSAPQATNYSLLAHPLQGKRDLREEEKKQLHEDAERLSRESKEFFKDLGSMGQRRGKEFADSLSNWIQKNYEDLSAYQREELQRFFKDLRRDYAGIRDMTIEKWQELIARIRQFLKRFERPEPEKGDDESETRNI